MDTASGEKRKPAYVAHVVRGEGPSSRWTEVGAAWPHKDGNGFDVVLDALPVGGRLVLRPPMPPKAD